MAKKITYKTLEIQDLMDYLENGDRSDVLNTFIMRDCSYIKAKMPRFTERFKIFVYLDSVVKFANDREVPANYLKKLFPNHRDIAEKYYLLGMPLTDFVGEVNKLQKELANKPIEMIKIAPEVKCVYTLMHDSQIKHYLAEHAWLTLVMDKMSSSRASKNGTTKQIQDEILDLLSLKKAKDKYYER